MTQRIIIMRHAQSTQSSTATDHDRPLDHRGKEQAPLTAQKMTQLQWIPTLVLCSDAQRTRETWSLMEPVLGNIKVEFSRTLYQASVEQVLSLISKVKDCHTLMVLGHNPTSEALVEWLSKEMINLGTANGALLESAILWPDILKNKGRWTLKQTITP